MKNSTAARLREIPAGYLLVGIDPHKRKHAVVAMTQYAVVWGKFKVDNSLRGYEVLLGWCKGWMEAAGCRGLMFALEGGGHYWRNLAYYLEERGIPFRLINPLTLKRRREGKDLNRRKNDYRDAEVAAELLRTGEFSKTRLLKGVHTELRAVYSCYCRLVKEKTRYKNLVKGLLDGIFPEFNRVFKDVSAYTALRVLSVCPIPKVISGMGEDDFVKLVRGEGKKRRLARKKLRYLHEVAKSSIGIEAGAESVALELHLVAERLEVVSRQIEETEGCLKELTQSMEESKYILSIVGVGPITVAGLLAELGPIGEYYNAKQLIKMAGTNPTEWESAGKKGRRSPMSKKGRPRLRGCTWKAVVCLMRHNADFRAWVKERQERPGKEHPLEKREAIGAASNRLLRLVYALVKNKTFYEMPQRELVTV